MLLNIRRLRQVIRLREVGRLIGAAERIGIAPIGTLLLCMNCGCQHGKGRKGGKPEGQTVSSAGMTMAGANR